jgi:hypothetical protein
MKAIRNLTMKLIAAALVATCLFAGAANAGPLFKGKVTLPSEVHWGKAVLPAGEYWLTLTSPSLPGIVTIQAANGSQTAFVMPVEIYRSEAKGTNALIMARRGNQSAVRALRLAEVGLTLRYEPQGAQNRKAIQEAEAIQEVPVLAARK